MPYTLDKEIKPLQNSARKKWGGYRVGAGRRAKRPEDRRVCLSTTVKPETKAWLQREWDRTRSSLGEIIDYLVGQVID